MADEPQPPDLEITDSVPGGLKVTTDRPYHILVVSDLTGSEAGTLSGPLQEGVVNVTADSFDEMMAAAGPAVNYTVADPLGSGGAMVEVNLRFDSVKSFDPTAIAEQMPATKTMMEVREKLVERMRGKASSSDVTNAAARAASADAGLSWITDSLKWTPGKAEVDTEAVDSLLGQIDLSGEGEKDDSPPPKSPIGAMVAAAAKDGTSIPAEEASALRRTLAEIDRRMSTWLTAVLHDPKVQALEAAWRSLAFVVSKIEFRKGVRLSVLHAPAAQLLERVRTLVIDPVFDEGADEPHVIAVDRQFGNSAADLEALDELAQHGASLPAVVLAGVSPQFFGVKHSWQIATLPTIANLFDQWQFAKWKSLRNQPYARSLAVMLGRGLLRVPYGQTEAGDLELAYKEPGITDKDFLWCSGAMVAACTVAQSVAEIGWPTAMSGHVCGRVDGFKTAEGGKKGDKKFGPSDTTLVQDKIEELGIAGVNAIAAIRDVDDAFVWNGMTAARVERTDPNALYEVSLPYQLFASRMSALLFALKPHLSGMTAEKVAAFVKQHVSDWVPFEGEPEGEQLAVQVRQAEDAPGQLEMAVTVTPPRSVLPGEVPVVMGYRIA